MSVTVSKANALIEVRKVTKRFGGTTALDQVSVTVEAGELLAICGENGAGKSTLMKILCGQYTEYEGEVLLRGQPLRLSGIKDAEAHGISIIHQELNLVEELSIAANIFLGREMVRGGFFLANGEMNRRAGEILTQLECRIPPETLAGQLRIGDQQLVEIAKALSLGSDVLIMDEPTSALTEAESARLDRVIGQLRKRGVTILYISHKMEEIFRLADRIVVLRDGKNVTTVKREEVTPREVAHLMVGRELNWDRQPHGEKDSEHSVVLEVRQLSRRWPQHPREWKLREVSFTASAGEILGFAGLMGAGRTELFECLYGNSDDEVLGDIFLAGKRVRFEHPAEAIAAGMAMVTEDRKRLGLFANLNVGENMTLNSLHQDRNAARIVEKGRETKRCRDMVGQLQVKTAGLQAAIGSLSGGNQQKCVMGRALLTQPQVLLLDDPTRGVDIGAKAEIYRLIRDLAQRGMCVLMASSELPELLHLCDRLIVLNEGRITADFSAAEATEQAIMEAATLNSAKGRGASDQNLGGGS